MSNLKAKRNNVALSTADPTQSYSFDAMELLLKQLLETTSDTQSNVSSLVKEVAVINATLKGPNGDNGINGRLKVVEATTLEMAQSIKDTNNQLLEYWTSKREATCFYKEDKRRDQIREDKIREENKKERQRQNNQFKAAMITVIGTIIVAGMTAGVNLYAINVSNNNTKVTTESSSPTK
jgi:hypothetical protein